ncbi:Orotidine 5'-phosphate decarboxylase [bacterium HR17]|uniref:Orotidine 5'-phosphate decarboxylase n=1 Tax=Candidatus Fervidibacter japonicus TaxID=2035412 RepID=A0A2H5XB82_9BACT|nr:Orotidine 5'-phosphate decarboxylase [bacterium HR17]
MNAAQRLIVALDVDDMATALALVDRLGDAATRYKVGYRLFLAAGWHIVDELQQRGKWVFADLKLHDIPATVAGAVTTLAHRRIGAITLHALGGSAMLRAAVQATQALTHRMHLWAVTVLTSLDDAMVRDELLIPLPTSDYAVHLARLARFCGCDGVIASGHEVERIKESCGDAFTVVVPAVRPSWMEQHDQRRTVTPSDAIKRGADFLVVGRAVTHADDPRSAFLRIADEITV